MKNHKKANNTNYLQIINKNNIDRCEYIEEHTTIIIINEGKEEFILLIFIAREKNEWDINSEERRKEFFV